MKQKLLSFIIPVKRLIQRFTSYLPTPLPRTPEEFEAFIATITAPHGLPDSVNSRFAVATMLMHLPPVCTRKSVRFFVNAIKKLQVNEVAYDILETARRQQQSIATPVEVPSATIPKA